MLLRYPVSKCCTTPNLCQQVHHHSLTNNPDSSIKHAGQLRDHRGQKWRVPETICPVSFLNYCLHVTSGNKCVVKFSLFSISCLRKCESHSHSRLSKVLTSLDRYIGCYNFVQPMLNSRAIITYTSADNGIG